MSRSAPPPPAAAHVWRIPTPLPARPREVNAYLVRTGPGRWMLVDGGLGTDEAWEALRAGVHAVTGTGWDGVDRLVLTHMHMDHVGLAARVREAAGARVAMGALDAERAAHAAAHPAEEARYRAELLRAAGAPAPLVRDAERERMDAEGLAPPVGVDDPCSGEGGELPGAPGWRWLWTPGHTAGHLSLLRPADGTLLAGDAVLPRVTPTLGVNRQRPDPVGDYLAALDRLTAAGVRRVLPGHGAPTGPERIRELRVDALAEAERVLLAAGGVESTAWQVVGRRYAGRPLPPHAQVLAIRETRAHLDRHAARGTLRVRRGDDGADRFVRGP